VTGNIRVTKATLVLGRTGKRSRRVVQRLTARCIPTLAGSRSAQPPFDWEKRSTWASSVPSGRMHANSPTMRARPLPTASGRLDRHGQP
jgi:hypothetical protein